MSRRRSGRSPMRKITVLSVIAWLGLVLGTPAAQAITNGQPDGSTHPEVGALVGYFAPAGASIAYCSGVLISPTVLVTAAHCGFLATPTVGVTFDEVYTSKSKVYYGTFYANPDFKPGSNAQSGSNPDIAVVV